MIFRMIFKFGGFCPPLFKSKHTCDLLKLIAPPRCSKARRVAMFCNRLRPPLFKSKNNCDFLKSIAPSVIQKESAPDPKNPVRVGWGSKTSETENGPKRTLSLRAAAEVCKLDSGFIGRACIDAASVHALGHLFQSPEQGPNFKIHLENLKIALVLQNPYPE